ncbi:ATP-binding protein [Pseudobacteriovorax antillogorgiicola]|uniref:Histidine kinase n=1 Tax=Pseudobacteriovorax antillogorgiicola TaxID=1513793 RepID=A0A1Y6BFS4_9BACT|nr:ATP-binding protein [Pseudobacteriovorax antillogorgiicola]TCS56205.1 two-component system chemotaxis sensor kinase CheA [Pseudobacteriovorax antillogorgiicola]SMF08590.1 hypothetical protein/two-component system, chemotaxis family, sensor kinase CheA [Pseudobacteriovorax antillogorgiicola]
MKTPKKSISGRLQAVILSVIFGSITLFAAAIGIYTTQEVNENIQQKSENVRGLAKLALTDPIWNYNNEAIELLSEAIVQDPDVVGFLVRDKDGTEQYKRTTDGFSNEIEDYRSGSSYIVSDADLVKEGEMIGTIVVVVSKARPIQSIKFTLMGVTVLALFLLIFVGATLNISIRNLIKKPIDALQQNSVKLAEGDWDVEIDTSREDELGVLASGFDYMRDKIKAFTNNLQEMIEEKTEDISSMLKNIEQGIFTITKDYKVHPEYSAFLENIFLDKDIADKPFEEFLFQRSSSMGSEEIDCAKSAIIASLGNKSVAFKLNHKHLPDEFQIEIDGQTKFLELDWCPILKHQKIEKMMVTVRDVTELKKLQAASLEKSRELEIIQQIVQLDVGKFQEVIGKSRVLLDECVTRLTKGSFDEDDIAILFRNLHTAKGILRTYGFKIVSSTVHEVEERFLEIKNSPKTDFSKDVLSQLHDSTQTILNTLDEYQTINDEKLGRKEGPGQISDEDMAEVKKIIDQFLIDTKQAESMLYEMSNLLTSRNHRTLQDHLHEIIERVSEVAPELGKIPLSFEYSGQDMIVSGDDWDKLDGAFTHMIRNSMDHGVETPEAREKLGKSPEGRIYLHSKINNDTLEVTLRDDGRGLNLKKLREIGNLPQDAPLEQAVEVIFKPHMSTAERVSDISGRGVGMDAVKYTIENDLGGRIIVEQLSKEKEGFAAIQFKIQIPLTSLKKTPETVLQAG